MRWSRASLPLAPLATSTTICPSFAGIGIQINGAALDLNVPCTVCSTSCSVYWTLVFGIEVQDIEPVAGTHSKSRKITLRTGMNGQQTLKDDWLGRECPKHRVAKSRKSIEQQHQLGHAGGTAPHAAMLGLILLQAARHERISQRIACRKDKLMPSPVMASTEPEASPIRTVRP